MSKETFTICIPALNEEEYLPKLLDGLSHQTFRDFEVVVVEGNSDDDTKKVASSYKDRLDIKVFSVPVRNPAYQRNFAAKNSKHEHLIFMDADTKVQENFLETVSQELATKKFDIAGSWLRPDSRRLVDKVIFSAFNMFFLEPIKKIKPGSAGAFIYISKEAFEKIGGFNEEMRFVEDFDLFAKAHNTGHKFYLFRNLPFTFSTRRLDQEGRIKWIASMIKGTYFFYIKGSVKDLNSVDYKFGNFGKTKK